MIVLKLYGGLGNQMFMYAFARMLQEEYRECIDINTYEFMNNEFSETLRKYSLNHLMLNKNVRCQGRVVSSLYEGMLRYKKWRFFENHKDTSIKNNKIFNEAVEQGLFSAVESYKFYDFDHTDKKIKFIDGYFMTWKYHNKIRHILQKEFQITTEPSSENKKKIKEISAAEAVCVHIRRGDYLSGTFKKHNYVCKEDFYIQAMRVIAEKVEHPKFYIFSTSPEDIKWIKQNYKFTYPVNYIEFDNPDYEELRLMLTCKHFIISNSSFSWWAQYLCDYKDKVVVAPSEWNLRNHLDVNDIYMPEWNIVKV